MSKKHIVMAIIAMFTGVIVAVFMQANKSPWPSEVGFNYDPSRKITVTPLQFAPRVDQAPDAEIAELSEEFFKDKWTIIFVGFTFCPDICPAAMSNLAKLEKQISDKDYADKFQVLFISVDPERDTLERISKYTNFFSPTFNAVTGSVEDLETMTKSMHLLFLIPEEPREENYSVEHSASFALISPQGNLVANLRETNNIDLMAEAIDAIQ